MAFDGVRALTLLVGVWLVGLALVALASPKGGALHVLAGRLFTSHAVFVALVVTPVGLYTHAWLIAAAAALTGYLAYAGRRVAARLASGAPASTADRVAVGCLALLGAGFVGLAGHAALTVGLVPFVPTVATLGALLLFLAGSEILRLGRPVGEASEALVHHVGMTITSLVLVATAASATLAPTLALPDWLTWLGPTAVGVPSAAWWFQRVRAQGRRATFL